jgi:hypothetical protein
MSPASIFLALNALGQKPGARRFKFACQFFQEGERFGARISAI